MSRIATNLGAPDAEPLESMSKFRKLILLAGLMCGASLGTHAQWAVTYAEHDWRFSIGGNPYGFVQEVSKPADIRNTTVYLGSHMFHTRLRAAHVVALALGPLGALAFLLLTRWPRKSV